MRSLEGPPVSSGCKQEPPAFLFPASQQPWGGGPTWATVGLRELSVDLDMDVWSP